MEWEGAVYAVLMVVLIFAHDIRKFIQERKEDNHGK